MEYDLKRLNGNSFERLVRALAFAEFGASGTVFSPGADGGRDFILNGIVRGYEARNWNGYLVLQSKCRENTNSQADHDWLNKQIEAEKIKYLSNINHKRPGYYVIATNVSLSGADGIINSKSKRQTSGGHTKVCKSLDQWKSDIGLIDYDLWTAEKICDLLKKHESIRRSYAAWVTPSDVLVKIMEELSIFRPDFKTTISRSLKTNLDRDQFVRLRDAGSVEDKRIRTSQVFVDLPLVEHISKSSPFEDDDQQYAINKLLARARERLDAELVTLEEADTENKTPRRNRIVLIGGPGQGKSTATLFLIQILRSVLIEDDPTSKRNDNVRNLYPEIIKRAKTEGVLSVTARRYPVNVQLPRYADAISLARRSGTIIPSLLTFIANDFSVSGDTQILNSDLRIWLQHYPWAVVLDGLDEVPPTGERPAILQAVNDFFTEVSEVNADVLVVVTTRPQGYNKDLDANIWEHWYLSELNKDQALNYAKAFGLARYPEDERRRNDVYNLLTEAAEKPATIKLIVSPLQVTILHYIVDTGGGVPAARWTLFNEYFEVLRRRERSKGGETKEILEKYWNQIGPIHHRAGLVLQADSEHGGNAAGKFTPERFAHLVRCYLNSEGNDALYVEKAVSDIMKLSLNRLVLLSTQQEGAISFDVRSLQEYMAAAAITSGDQNVMEERLSFIAGRAHWRHVFLIAASRCFADDTFHYRRSTIVAIPRQMDSVDPDKLIKNGAKLALELVEDGIGQDHPLSRRPLLLHACDLFHLGPSSVDIKMTKIWDNEGYSILIDFINPILKQSNTLGFKAVWRLFFLMAAFRNEWAIQKIEAYWPADPVDALIALSQIEEAIPNNVIMGKVVQSILNAGPKKFRSYLNHRVTDIVDTTCAHLGDACDDLRGVTLSGDEIDESNQINLKSRSGIRSPISFSIRSVSLDRSTAVFGKKDLPLKQWKIYTIANEFVAKPSKEALAESVQKIQEMELFEDIKAHLSFMPWPLASVIDECSDFNSLTEMQANIRSGLKGDMSDWSAAEKRWASEGITFAELSSFWNTGRWFGSSIGAIGAPYPSTFFVEHSAESFGMALELVDIYIQVADNRRRSKIPLLISLCLAGTYEKRQIDDVQIARKLINALSDYNFRFQRNDLLFLLADNIWLERDLVEKLATYGRCHTVYQRRSLNLLPIFGAFERFPDLRNLLFVIVRYITRHGKDGINVGLSSLHRSAFEFQQNDDIEIRACVAYLQMLRNPHENIDSKVLAIACLDSDSILMDVVVRALAGNIFDIETRTIYLIRLIKEFRSSGSDSINEFSEILRKALDYRPSNIGLTANWKHRLSLYSDSYECLLPA